MVLQWNFKRFECDLRGLDGAIHFWTHRKKILAFEWDLRDIDGATHFFDKKSSGIMYIYNIYIYNTIMCNLQYTIWRVWMGFKGHRWRNSFLDKKSSGIIYMYIYIHNTNMCNKQAKMIGHVVNLVNNTLMSIYWSGSCAICLFILR